jgi:hypothetical protein
VGGAKAAYFGADQPRITAEVLLPWSVLGVSAPPPGTPLRVEVAVSSWHRERWMSLSGRPPAAAMGHPAGWRKMRLGSGSQMIEVSPSTPILPPG